MQSEYDISIIIPTWNVEQYLIGGRLAIINLIESINKQTAPDLYSIETLFVDDMSTDNTRDVIESEINKYPNIHGRFIGLPQKAGSPSVGRNVGIQKSKGKYIFFMDHDDQMGDEGSLLDLFEHCLKWNSDVIIGKKSGNVAQNLYEKGNFEKIDFSEINPMWTIAIFGNLYKKSFLTEYAITFPVKNIRYEDFAFLAKVVLISNAKISLVTNYNYYAYLNGVLTTDGFHLSSAVYGDRAHSEVLNQISSILYSFNDDNFDAEAAVIEGAIYRWPFKQLMKFKKDRQKQITNQIRFKNIQNALKYAINDNILIRLPLKHRLLVLAMLYENFEDAIEHYKAAHILLDREEERVVTLKSYSGLNFFETLVVKYKNFESSSIDSNQIQILNNNDDSIKIFANNISGHVVKLVLLDRSQNIIDKFDLKSGENNFFLSEISRRVSLSRKIDFYIEEDMNDAVVTIKLEKQSLVKDVRTKKIKIFANYKGGISLNKLGIE